MNQLEKLNKYLKSTKVFVKEDLKEGAYVELDKDDRSSQRYEGLKLITYNFTIFIGIEAGQQCCESYGSDFERRYLVNKEEYQSFKGARVLEILRPEGRDETTLPLIIKTDRGEIDVWVYCEHNGYYGHNTLIKIFYDFYVEDGWL